MAVPHSAKEATMTMAATSITRGFFKTGVPVNHFHPSDCASVRKLKLKISGREQRYKNKPMLVRLFAIVAPQTQGVQRRCMIFAIDSHIPNTPPMTTAGIQAAKKLLLKN